VTDDLLLSLQGVSVGYGRHAVLQSVDLAVRRGSFTGLLGANGSGKSTLLKTILGILPPLAGRMEFRGQGGGQPVLGYVPQREALDSIFLVSCFEMVLMGACGRVGPGCFFNQSEKDWARHCLRETGADDLARKRFSELSGGQKQRVLIARALATKPEFLLLDEPTAGIDASATQSILELLRRLHSREQLSILMVSHDLPAIRRCAQDVIWLHQGKVLHGAVNDLLRREQVEAMLELELN